MPLIQLNEAKKHYCRAAFTLTIKPHDFILISGKNGTGKTTLLELILGFKKPDTGFIKKKTLKINYLPEVAALPNEAIVSHYLLTLAKVKRDPFDDGFLHLFQIPLFKKICELSKGNRQKLAILTTLIGKPDLVVLDEPLSGLDDKSVTELLDVLKKKQAAGFSFVVSTHQPERLQSLATQQVIL